MPLKIANLRLELGEPEEALPEKLAAHLGVNPDEIARWRILRKSLDARRHDDLHFIYAAEVELPDAEAGVIERTRGRDVERFEAEHFEWPTPGAAPLEHRPVIVGAGPAGLFAGYLLALDGYRPIILERGREVKDRVADVRARLTRAARLIPKATISSAKGARGRFPTANSPAATPGRTCSASSKSWPIATVSRRSFTSNGRIWAQIGCR